MLSITSILSNFQWVMSNVSMKSIALKWFYFSCLGGTILYSKFCHLAFKQLGFTPQQIGVTTLIGGQHILIPLIFLFADKFRARKAVAWIGTVAVTLACFTTFSPLIISLPTCFTAFSALSSNHSNNLVFISKLRLTNASMHSINSSNSTSLAHDTNYSRSHHSSKEFINTMQRVPWSSKLFIMMAASRGLTMLFDRVLLALGNLAVITYLKDKRTSYGSYFMWSQIGAAVLIFFVAFLAWIIRINLCGIEGYGYSLVFIVAGCMAFFSMVSLPWFQFEYKETKTINWRKLKSILFNSHYVFMFFPLFYTGLCCSFQIYWEFWYLGGLSASPLLMGGAALIRRPLLVLSAFISRRFLENFGEIRTVCVGMLFFASSFCALSFTRTPWFVLGIDIFQAAAYALSYCALAVHFSKAGSKQISGVILGKYAS